MPYCQTREGELFYARRGPAEPVPGSTMVCVHGAGGTHQHWGNQFRSLRQARSLIALDLPGHGRSAGPGRNSVATYGQVLVAALDSLGLEQVILAGHSMGGAVALRAALEYPERVAGLVLVSSGARLPVLPALFEHLEQGRPAEAVRLIVERAYGRGAAPALRAAGEKAFLKTDPQVLYGDLQACAGYNSRERLAEIRCPTLVLCGDDDRVTPLKFSHTLYEGIGGARLIVLPGAGHMALLERPASLSTAITRFLAEE